MYGKYAVKLEYKSSRGALDTQFVPCKVVKNFFPVRQDVISKRFWSTYTEGIFTKVNLSSPSYNGEAVYQENIDADRTREKVRLQDEGFVILESDTVAFFNNYQFRWEHCTCTTSIVYRVTLTYVGEAEDRGQVYISTIL